MKVMTCLMAFAFLLLVSHLSWAAETPVDQGLALLNGQGVTKNCDEAIRIFEEQAAQKNAQAATLLSSIYEKALCGNADPVKAVFWQKKAAELGSGVSIYFLGMRYLTGDGVPLDSQKALQLFLRGAKRGDPDSEARAGLLLLDAKNDRSHDKKAFKLITHAAAAGVLDAQFTLSQLLGQGRGTDQNRQEALRWLAIAAMRGQKEAKETWPIMKKMMLDASQAQQFEKEAAAWKPTDGISSP